MNRPFPYYWGRAFSFICTDSYIYSDLQNLIIEEMFIVYINSYYNGQGTESASRISQIAFGY